MKKENVVSLVLGTIGTMLFAIGMCMCLLTEWNAAQQGIYVGLSGLVVLLMLLIIRRKAQGKPAVTLNAKTIGIVLLTLSGFLALGTGMCMSMVWEGLMIWGIVVGMIGIALLLSLIPICKGIQ